MSYRSFGITVDYATGKSCLSGETITPEPDNGNEDGGDSGEKQEYILNTNTGTFHYPDCTHVSRTSEKNKKAVTATHDEMVADGYSPCGTCKP